MGKQFKNLIMYKMMAAEALETNLNFDSETHVYEIPKKRIVDPNTLAQF